MVSLLITSALILSLLAVALYFWQRPRKLPDFEELPPPPDKLRGLFDPVPEQELLAAQDQTNLTRNELQITSEVANAFIDTHIETLNRNSVSKMLHLAALSDDADVFRRAAELSLATWRDGRLSNVSSTELQALLNGEYWVLSSSTRSSGAGFVLKRTLAAARRELEESINNQPSTASS